MSPFSNLAALTLFGAMLLSSVASAGPPADARFSMLSDEEAWRRLPAAEKGSGQPLPSWARMLAANCRAPPRRSCSSTWPSGRRARSTPSSAPPCAGLPPTPTIARMPKRTRRPTPAAPGSTDARIEALAATATPAGPRPIGPRSNSPAR